MRFRFVVPAILFACMTLGPAARAADPTTADCLTASETSLKLRGEHKLREARNQLLVCAATNCPADVRNECLRRVDQVNASIPTIIFEAKDAAGNDVSAVKVTMDGQTLADRLEGTAISLDPGEHVFRFEAQGQPPFEKTLVIREAEKDRHERIVIGAAATTAPRPALAAPAPAPSATGTSPPPAADAGSSSWSTQKTMGLVVGGVGVAGLIVGGIFGALSVSAHNSYEQNCGSNIGAPAGFCNAQGVSGQSDAASKGTLSTVFFVGGGVLAAGGAVLFFTAPRGAGATQVGVGPGSVVVSGRF